MGKEIYKILRFLLIIILGIGLIWGLIIMTNPPNKTEEPLTPKYSLIEDITPTLNTSPTTDNPYPSSPSVFKISNDQDGYKYCSFIFNWEDEPYINKTSYKFKPLCNISEYPIIKDFLYDYYLVTLVELDTTNFAAQYAGNGNIEINKHFKVAKNLDLYLAHEIAHSATETLNLPDWLSEGIADYSAYRYFGTQYKLGNMKHKDILHWSPSYSQSDIGDNIRGYAHSAYIVRKFVDKYGDDKLRELIIALDGKLNFGDSIDVKNQKILEVIQKLTNNSTISMEDIMYPTD